MQKKSLRSWGKTSHKMTQLCSLNLMHCTATGQNASAVSTDNQTQIKKITTSHGLQVPQAVHNRKLRHKMRVLEASCKMLSSTLRRAFMDHLYLRLWKTSLLQQLSCIRLCWSHFLFLAFRATVNWWYTWGRMVSSTDWWWGRWFHKLVQTRLSSLWNKKS